MLTNSKSLIMTPLTCAFLLNSVIEDYLLNKGKEGKRKHSEKKDESGEESEEDEQTSTPTAAGGGDEKSISPGSDTTGLEGHMSEMCLSNHGYNFEMVMPHIQFSWLLQNVWRHSIDILLVGGLTESDVVAQITKEGTGVIVTSETAGLFLGTDRLYKQHKGSLFKGDKDINPHPKVVALGHFLQEIKEANDMEGFKSSFKIELPFRCEQTFSDPFGDNDGCYIGYYKQKQNDGLVLYYSILHLELVGADKPRTPSKVTRRVMEDSPPSPDRSTSGMSTSGGF